MKLNDAFPSKWLKADDMEDGDMILTITAVEVEQMKDNGVPTNKLLLSFKEEEKQLVCNKTNAKAIAKLHGDDTDDWIGKRVALYATEVEYQGETMLGIRVRLKAPKTVGAPPARQPVAAGPQGFGVPRGRAPAPVPPADVDFEGGDEGDSDIPF